MMDSMDVLLYSPMHMNIIYFINTCTRTSQFVIFLLAKIFTDEQERVRWVLTVLVSHKMRGVL